MSYIDESLMLSRYNYNPYIYARIIRMERYLHKKGTIRENIYSQMLNYVIVNLFNQNKLNQSEINFIVDLIVSLDESNIIIALEILENKLYK